MKYCTKCGLELLDEELTCPQCKAKQKNNNKVKNILGLISYVDMIFLIIAIIITVGGIVVYLLSSMIIGTIMIAVGLLSGIVGLILSKKRLFAIIISIICGIAVIATIIGMIVLKKCTDDAIAACSFACTYSDTKYKSMQDVEESINKEKGFLNKMDSAIDLRQYYESDLGMLGYKIGEAQEANEDYLNRLRSYY